MLEEGIGAALVEAPPAENTPYHNKLLPVLAEAVKALALTPAQISIPDTTGAVGNEFILTTILVLGLSQLVVLLD